jgi:hypothetical protein
MIDQSGPEDLQTVIVQILSIKQVPSQQGKPGRYRIVVSDGTYYMQGYLY